MERPIAILTTALAGIRIPDTSRADTFVPAVCSIPKESTQNGRISTRLIKGLYSGV